MKRFLLAIDPGNIESGICLIDTTSYKPVRAEKTGNDGVFGFLDSSYTSDNTEVVCEMIASYGMAVGATVFDTCVWIGRFAQFFAEKGFTVSYIYRREEKLAICHSPKANDTNIRQALVDRFARNDSNFGKGNKKTPGWFYGFKNDVWQAYAVGVTYIDKIYGRYI